MVRMGVLSYVGVAGIYVAAHDVIWFLSGSDAVSTVVSATIGVVIFVIFRVRILVVLHRSVFIFVFAGSDDAGFDAHFSG